MKKEWRGYNLLDLFLVGIGIISVITTSIIFHTQWYVIISSLLGIFCVFTQAKGKVATQFIGIAYFAFYVFISYEQAFYGEAILWSIMIPMYIYGAIHWLAHRDKKDQVVIVRSNLSWQEWLISMTCIAGVSVGVYFLLKALNTAELVVSTLSFVSVLPGMYLLIRRCKWNQVAFLINDTILPVLWTILIVNGNLAFIPMVIGHVLQIVYDVYGLIEWIKLEKKQAIKESFKE